MATARERLAKNQASLGSLGIVLGGQGGFPLNDPGAPPVESVNVSRRAKPEPGKLGTAGLGEGVVSGALAGSVFGPVGALIGAGVGILARNLKKGELEAAAQEADVRNQLDDGITRALDAAAPFANTEIDQAQLQNVATRQAQLRELAQHPDPNVRTKALEQLGALSAEVGTWMEDVETRAEVQQDAQAAHREEQRKFFQSELDTAFDNMNRVDAEVDAIIKMANELGPDSMAVQEAYRKLLGASLVKDQGDGGINIGLPGVGGISLSEGMSIYKYSYDEIVKGAAAIRDAQHKHLSAYGRYLEKSAYEQYGFTIGQNIDPETGQPRLDPATGKPQRMTVEDHIPVPSMETKWNHEQGVDDGSTTLGHWYKPGGPGLLEKAKEAVTYDSEGPVRVEEGSPLDKVRDYFKGQYEKSKTPKRRTED